MNETTKTNRNYHGMQKPPRKLIARRKLAWFSITMVVILILSFFQGHTLMTPPPVASAHALTGDAISSGFTRRIFAFEPTSISGQWMEWGNMDGYSQTVKVSFYDPSGVLTCLGGGTACHTQNYTTSFTLLPYQTKSFRLGTGTGEWNIAVLSTCGLSGNGTQTAECAYTVISSSDRIFSHKVHHDELQIGTGYSGIWPRDITGDVWWGMYNYNDSSTKADYYYLSNPSGSTATATIDAYSTDGVFINTKTFTIGAHRTIKVYPAYSSDNNINPATYQNIGLHLTSSEGVALSVKTHLADDYKGPGATPPYGTHDKVAENFIPWSTACNASEGWFTNAVAGSGQVAVRVTNPNSQAVKVSETLWTQNSAYGTSYSRATSIPARGTKELELVAAVGTIGSAATPQEHTRYLFAWVDTDNDNVRDPDESEAQVHAHVSYYEHIDLPVPLRTDFWWPRFNEDTREVFVVNPYNFAVTFKVDGYDYNQPGGTTQRMATGSYPIPARGSIVVAYTSDMGFPSTNGDNVTFHGYAVNAANQKVAVAIHLQEPEYGDVMPADCGRGDNRLSSVGNFVWLDENNDGYQDAGEAGIPNVKVSLLASGQDGTYGTADDITIAYTYTDTWGGYLFSNLYPAEYRVVIDSANFNAGQPLNNMFQTTNAVLPGADFGNQATPYTIQLDFAEEAHADFGFNWNTNTEVNTNTGTAALGDRLWVDSDGNGSQGHGEIGIQGVTMQLFGPGPDGLFNPGLDGIYGTADDDSGAPLLTALTNHNGNYIFDGLAQNAYAVQVAPNNYAPAGPLFGWTQTGDPDHFGTTGSNDHLTTVPVVLSPGDVFVNADFGYQPPAGTTGVISDKVWLDHDADGVQDGSELGIPNVTVALVKDTNGSGTWEVGEPIIGTDRTDASGIYQFTGLPTTDGAGTDDYLVMVNDTENVLAFYNWTFDKDGAAAPATGLYNKTSVTAVSNLTTTAVIDVDFGYTALDQTTTQGLIGDLIFFDANANNLYDTGEPGIENVQVLLYRDLDGDGVIEVGDPQVAYATTDENGNYYFGNLAAGNYVVWVDGSNFEAGAILHGMINSRDPEGAPGNNQSFEILSSGEIVLTKDFGYKFTGTSGSIGNLIWEDINANGVVDSGEPGIQDVTVDLYRDLNGNGLVDPDEPILATTKTDPSGAYLFSNLSTTDNGLGTAGEDYIVTISDRNSILFGYWHSLGAMNIDNNSQVDPYALSLSVANPNNTKADFGYFIDPAGLGNFIWEDLDGDGIQDGGEPGIDGVLVTLTITYAGGGGTTTLKTITNATGYYSFGNLLLDEDHDGVGAGEPTYSITVAPIPGLFPTILNAGANDAVDSDNPAGQLATTTEGITNETYDFGYLHPSSIGDYVWLDEDGDGVQDAGEAGIPNVTVVLSGTDHNGNPVSASTVTDANGGYLFGDIPPGSYTVSIDTTTLADGLEANPTFDENGIGTPHTSTVILGVNEEYVTADFGYNWSSTCETGTPGAAGCLTPTGAIGDRLWVDADGDGLQDAGEPGLPGITVQLYYDLDNNGVVETLYGTSVTDPNGNYIFDNLLPDLYEVRVNNGATPAGYTQTGDPDQQGVPCTTCDNKSLVPLGPGDVYVNIDFGYQPATSSTIGDLIYFDVSGNSVFDGADYGIPNVTVALLDNSGNVIATTTTSDTGKYEFPGLPAGTYTVWVNDTNNVLAGLKQSGDPDGGFDDQSTTTVDGINNDLNQDHGYTAPLQDNTYGLIGDTVFLDRDSSGGFSQGEGLEGITVLLYNSTGTTLYDKTITDENGHYYFGVLPGGDYRVVVDSGTLPAGLTNTVDPDGGGNGLSNLTLPSGGTNLLQDFGYEPDGSQPVNTISGTLWKDIDADGFKDPSETAYLEGVTIALYDPNGNIVGTTVTDANGDYSFTNLPNGTYTVDVTDTSNVLNGYWHSLGTPDTNNNSQVDPYTVSVSGGATVDWADFGYYIAPANLGNYVWNDIDGDGIQEVGEPGIPSRPVLLTITYPSGAVVKVQTTTNTSGFYSFLNLLADENYDGIGVAGAGGTEPLFSISTATPPGFFAVPTDAGVDDNVDSDNYLGQVATLTEGATNNTYDFGFDSNPTFAGVTSFAASGLPGWTIRISWQAFNVNLKGFYLYRSLLADGSDRVLLTPQMISAQFPPSTDLEDYEYADSSVQNGVTYYYWLEMVDLSDVITPYGSPLSSSWNGIFLPLIVGRP